jgi:hypothetical protein
MKRFAIAGLALAACSHAPSGQPLADSASGRVTFELRASPTSGLQPTFAVTACFWSGAPAPSLDGGATVPCRGNLVGSCCVSDVDPGVDRQGCTDENVNVGAVQLLVNGSVAGTMALSSGNYLLAPGATLVWKPGDKLEVRASGADAFDATVSAVGAPALSQPALSVGQSLTFTRSQTLLFSWSPVVPASFAESWISATEPQTGDLQSADCFLPGDPGQASFPGDMLSNLPAGLGTAEVALENDALEGTVEVVSRGEAEIAVQTQ